MSYRMHLYQSENEGAPWKVKVEFESLPGELRNRVAKLKVLKDQSMEENRVSVTHTSESLDDAFADTLASSLRRFIEVITPVVREYEDERNQEEA